MKKIALALITLLLITCVGCTSKTDANSTPEPIPAVTATPSPKPTAEPLPTPDPTPEPDPEPSPTPTQELTTEPTLPPEATPSPSTPAAEPSASTTSGPASPPLTTPTPRPETPPNDEDATAQQVQEQLDRDAEAMQKEAEDFYREQGIEIKVNDETTVWADGGF